MLSGGDEDLLAQHKRQIMKREDLHRLQPGAWVGDEVRPGIMLQTKRVNQPPFFPPRTGHQLLHGATTRPQRAPRSSACSLA